MARNIQYDYIIETTDPETGQVTITYDPVDYMLLTETIVLTVDRPLLSEEGEDPRYGPVDFASIDLKKLAFDNAPIDKWLSQYDDHLSGFNTDLAGTGVITPDPAKIYRYTNSVGPYTHIDFKTGLRFRLAKKIIMKQGVVIRNEYYESATIDPNTGVETFYDLIVTEDIEYERNVVGLAMQRTTRITWFDEDDNPLEIKKVLRKTYNLADRLKESYRRRTNILDDIKEKIMVSLSLSGLGFAEVIGAGSTFQTEHALEIQTFKETGNGHPIITSVMDDDSEWLDIDLNLQNPIGITLRQYMIKELTL